jgi:hypothetical protein
MNSYERIYNLITEEYASARQHSRTAYQRNTGLASNDPRRQNPSIAASDAERLRKARLEKHAKFSDAAAKDIPGSAKSLKVRLATKAPLRRAARGGYR